MQTQLTQLARQQRSELSAADSKNLEAIARAYALMYDRLQGDVNSLVQAISELDQPTSAEIKRLPEYKRLMRRSEDELNRFNAFLEITIGGAALAALNLGLEHSAQLLGAAGIPFTSLPPGAMSSLLDYLRFDGPLYARLKLITDSTINSVVQSIIEGVANGYNPQKIAGIIQDAFGGGLTDALRNTRTVQLYSYRDSARANYMASDGIVTGWIWWAELDGDVCEACASEHGSIHDLDETLDGHYNCRCAALPYIEGLTDPEQTGEEWFNGLSQEEQINFMGQNKWDSYQNGYFTFSDMARRNENEVYGTMIGVTPLQDLLGE